MNLLSQSLFIKNLSLALRLAHKTPPRLVFQPPVFFAPYFLAGRNVCGKNLKIKETGAVARLKAISILHLPKFHLTIVQPSVPAYDCILISCVFCHYVRYIACSYPTFPSIARLSTTCTSRPPFSHHVRRNGPPSNIPSFFQLTLKNIFLLSMPALCDLVLP